MKEKNIISGIIIILLLVALIVGIVLGYKIIIKKYDNVNIPQVQIIEHENKGLKTEVKETIKEIRYIQDSRDYLDLRKQLDSLIRISGDTSEISVACNKTVKIQDTIIEKQGSVIVKQQKVINNDSIIKTIYIDTIKALKEDVASEKKKGKRKLWRGRIEGGVVGFVVGYVVGKKF